MLGLRSQKNGSIFDGTGGTLTWIAAGRYGGYLSAPSMPHPSDNDLTGESSFNQLVATVGGRKGRVHDLFLNGSHSGRKSLSRRVESPRFYVGQCPSFKARRTR